MTEIRGPDYELAEKDYMLGMKYKDIAEKYNVSINTVKSWKQRYNWSRKGVHTNKESVHTKLNTGSNNIKPVAKEVESVLKNSELNDKQRLFCLYYSKSLIAQLKPIENIKEVTDKYGDKYSKRSIGSFQY